MSAIPINPLDFLHKLSMQRGVPPPVFKQVDEQGPAHMKTFVWSCSFNGIEAEGVGRSKKEAKSAAAKFLKDQLDLDSLPQPGEKKRKSTPANQRGQQPFPKKKKTEFPPRPFFPGPFPGDLADGCFADNTNDEAVAEVARLGPPMSYGYGMGPIFASRLSKLDRNVIRKHKEIYPGEAELAVILELVGDTEEAMKLVAEEVGKETTQESDKEPSSRIKGMVRVGDLAKGLLLRDSVEVQVVVMCQKAPTKSLLESVANLLPTKLKEVAPLKDYQVTKSADSASIKVICKPEQKPETPTLPPAFTCNVAMTSVAVRKKPAPVAPAEDEEKKNNGEHEEAYDEVNCLPKESCLGALAELRHSRWFCSVALNLPSCVECIRLVKDLMKRDPNWSVLNDWTVELLVERALYSAHVPLNPAASIMRVMEVVASGIFLDPEHGLRDPCEHEDVDPTSYLTLQQREDLTRSAQQYLRMMHFRQIHVVLGMPLEEEDFIKMKTETVEDTTAVKSENGSSA